MPYSDVDDHLAANPAPAEPTRLAIREWLIIALIVSATSAGLVATYIVDQPSISPFDEWVYVDYVDKLGHLGVAQQGEFIDEEALELASCRGVHVWGPIGSPCGGPYEPAAYPLGGRTSADIHPPTYFAATAAAASIIRATGISEDLLTSSRLVGAMWLFGGLIATVALALEVGSSKWAATGVALLLSSLPLIRWTNSYITPDAANLLVGGLVLLGAVKVRQDRWPWWSMMALGALAGAVKTQNALAVAAALVFLAWGAIQAARTGDSSGRNRAAFAAAGVAGGFLIAQLSWIATRSIISLGASPDTAAESPITLSRLVKATTSFVFDLGLGGFPPYPEYVVVATAVLVAGAVGALFYRPVRDERWGLAVGVVLMVFLGGPILMIAQQVVFGAAADNPIRYGGSLLPGISAVTSAAFVSRWRGIALLGLGLGSVGIVLWSNLVRV